MLPSCASSPVRKPAFRRPKRHVLACASTRGPWALVNAEFRGLCGSLLNAGSNEVLPSKLAGPADTQEHETFPHGLCCAGGTDPASQACECLNIVLCIVTISCRSAICWIFEVASLAEDRRGSLLSPDPVSRSLRMLYKVQIALLDVAIDHAPCLGSILKVAVVYHSLGHPTKHRLDYIQELGSRRKRSHHDFRPSIMFCPPI